LFYLDLLTYFNFQVSPIIIRGQIDVWPLKRQKADNYLRV